MKYVALNKPFPSFTEKVIQIYKPLFFLPILLIAEII